MNKQGYYGVDGCWVPDYRHSSQSPKNEGKKFDDDKVRLELLAPEFLFAVATILTFGAKKYDAYNWALGMKWSRVFGAMMRHMWAWWGSKEKTSKNFAFGDLDTESTFSHLWHAACCLMFLVAYEERAKGEDDRWGGLELDD